MKGSGTTIWDDLAADDDLAVLDPGPPDRLPAAPEVLVVGGGVIGLAVATACTRAGMDVLLIERGRLAGQASGRAAGGLAPDGHPELGESWRVLARRSLELHRALDAHWGYGLRRTNIRIAPGAVIEDQAHVDPLRMCIALARRAGTVATGVEVVGHDGSTVLTSRGEIRPGHIVHTTGTAPPGVQLPPQSWVKGHLIATEPAPFRIDELHAPLGVESLVLQLEDGRLVAGGTKEPGRDDASVDESVVEQIEAEMAAVLPEAAGLEVTHRWTCFRPHIVGEAPVVDRVPGTENAWFAAGFYSTGILMAPVIGDLVADAITGVSTEIGALAIDRAPS